MQRKKKKRGGEQEKKRSIRKNKRSEMAKCILIALIAIQKSPCYV